MYGFSHSLPLLPVSIKGYYLEKNQSIENSCVFHLIVSFSEYIKAILKNSLAGAVLQCVYIKASCICLSLHAYVLSIFLVVILHVLPKQFEYPQNRPSCMAVFP